MTSFLTNPQEITKTELLFKATEERRVQKNQKDLKLQRDKSLLGERKTGW